MISCIIVLSLILGVPAAPVVLGIGPRRIGSAIIHPLKTLRKIGEWGMERYLALEPLTETEHIASICAIPALLGLTIWINFQP